MEIKEITGDQPVSGEFLIVENQLRTAKNGSCYLALRIADKTGEIAAKVWDADEATYRKLGVGQVIRLHNVQPKIYKDQIQLEWEAKKTDFFTVLPETKVDYGKFLPQAPGNLAEYWDYLVKTIAEIEEPSLKKLLRVFFDDQEFVDRFVKVPAALKRHHAYIGGLLEHTAGVTAVCKAAAAYYPMVNKDLLLTGAILHDIGKTRTYKMERGFDGTDPGKLLGHLILGVNMVERAIAELFGKPAEDTGDPLLMSLVHLLVSHHGIMEWGSPVEPLTLEACILHHADNMDAQITKFLAIIRNRSRDEDWAVFDPGLGRSIYLKGLNERPERDDLSEGA
ncbi:MAG: HD domain-containing protein [Firmicutes bacterium]|nr:HD domain-containing protein [Bacillota bacterium]